MSVVVSTRDRSHFLRSCLESLSLQDCSFPFEVVVVDNASSDDTPQLVQEFGRKDQRFRYIFEGTIGLSHAKNVGVRASVSPLIVFTDDDVVLDPLWLRSFVECAERQTSSVYILGGPIHPVPHDLGDGRPGSRTRLYAIFRSSTIMRPARLNPSNTCGEQISRCPPASSAISVSGTPSWVVVAICGAPMRTSSWSIAFVPQEASCSLSGRPATASDRALERFSGLRIATRLQSRNQRSLACCPWSTCAGTQSSA